MRVPILAGPLKGRWWRLTSLGQPGRVLTGTYEPAHTALFAALVRPGATVVDVGAHVGYYTLLASTLAGPDGAVWAFEPDPRNCGHLRRHVEINQASNVEIQESAVSNTNGTARFQFGSGSGTGRLHDRGTLQVRTVSLDAFCGERGILPSLIKIDAEGAEVGVLQGARSLLAQARPAIILSTHDPALHRNCIAILRSLRYRIDAITGHDVDTTTELLGSPD